MANPVSKKSLLLKFLQNPPAGFEKLERKEKFKKAAEASKMSFASVQVATYTDPKLRKAFGLPPRGNVKVKGKDAIKKSDGGAVTAAKNAIELIGTFEELKEVAGFLKTAIQKKIKSARSSMRALSKF